VMVSVSVFPFFEATIRPLHTSLPPFFSAYSQVLASILVYAAVSPQVVFAVKPEIKDNMR